MGETFPLFCMRLGGNVEKSLKSPTKIKNPDVCSLIVSCDDPTLEMRGKFSCLQKLVVGVEGLGQLNGGTRTELMAKFSFTLNFKLYKQLAGSRWGTQARFLRFLV